MSAAPVYTPLRPINIEVTSGPHKGQRVSVHKPIFKIGRGDDNDLIFVSDGKVSRNHVEIHQENGQVRILNVSQKNVMSVNGQKVDQAILSGNVNVTIGDTQLEIEVENVDFSEKTAVSEKTARVQVAPAASAPPAKVDPFAGYQAQQPHNYPPPSSVPAPKSKMPFYIVVIGLVVGGLWYTGSGGVKRKETQIRGSEQIVKDLVASEEVIRNLRKTAEKTGADSAQYKLAQEQYIKGFRDYRQGQYARASQAFLAALSFYPQHELARKYLALSRKKFDELVKFNMNQGRKYLAKNNYRLCAASFSKVLFMLKDANDPTYKEAKQFYDQCVLLQQGRF